jgi:hypothetical protein
VNIIAYRHPFQTKFEVAFTIETSPRNAAFQEAMLRSIASMLF